MIYHEHRDGKPMSGLYAHHTKIPEGCTICSCRPAVYAYSYAQGFGEEMPSPIPYELADAPPPEVLCESCAERRHGDERIIN